MRYFIFSKTKSTQNFEKREHTKKQEIHINNVIFFI